MKALKTQTLKFLKTNQENNGNINQTQQTKNNHKTISPKTFFQTINSFSNSNLLEEAKKSINYITKYQNKDGTFTINHKTTNPIYFLETIYTYLSQTEHKSSNTDCQTEVKNYIKYIKKAIEYIENSFDKIYLLIHDTLTQNTTPQTKIFKAKQNAILLSFIESLCEILNKYEYNKEADYLFMLKGKLELGFNRYIWNRTNSILIKQFDENSNFKIASPQETLEILQYYKHYNIRQTEQTEEDYYKNQLNICTKNLNKETNYKKILTTLIALKTEKPQLFTKHFKIHKKT